VTRPPIDTYELETAAGFRLLVFNYDAFRGKDVRILVDGREVAWRQSIAGLAGVILPFVVTYGAWFLLVATIARRPNVEF
jgi:hypothetical protein